MSAAVILSKTAMPAHKTDENLRLALTLERISLSSKQPVRYESESPEQFQPSMPLLLIAGIAPAWWPELSEASTHFEGFDLSGLSEHRLQPVPHPGT